MPSSRPPAVEVCSSTPVPTTRLCGVIMQKHTVSVFFCVESEVMKWVVLERNSSFGVGHLIVFVNQCKYTGMRFVLAINITL